MNAKEIREEQAPEVAPPPAVVEEQKEKVVPFNPYVGVAAKRFTNEQTKILTELVDTNLLDILPTGEVYLPQTEYRRILNKVFGPGGWGLIPLGQALLKDNVMYREYALYVEGRYIAQAVGEQAYFAKNPRMTYATAAESAKSNALVRCCKDLGIASECWDKRFAEEFKQKHCVEVKVKVEFEDQNSGEIKHKIKKVWRRNNAKPFFNEASEEDSPKSQESHSTTAKTGKETVPNGTATVKQRNMILAKADSKNLSDDEKHELLFKVTKKKSFNDLDWQDVNKMVKAIDEIPMPDESDIPF